MFRRFRKALMTFVLALLIAAATLAAPAYAQQGSAPGPVNCGDAGSNYDIGQCLIRELAHAERELAGFLDRRRAMIDAASGMPPEQRDQWRRLADQSQEMFLAYRQTECALMRYEWWGGSGASNAVGFCRLELTRERIRRIRPELH